MLSMLYRLTVGDQLLKSGTTNGPIRVVKIGSYSPLVTYLRIPTDMH